MLRKDNSPRGSTSGAAGAGAASQASRARSRSADAKSSMGARVSRTTAIPISTLPNDVRCMASRYDMILSNDCRRGLAVFAGGKNGVVSVRSAVSGAANSIGQLGRDATFGGSGTGPNVPGARGGGKGSVTPRGAAGIGLAGASGSMLAKETGDAEYLHRRHGVTVECMTLVPSDLGALLWCGMTDGSVQVFRTASGAAANSTAFTSPPSPRAGPNAPSVSIKAQHATPKSLVFTERHHNGPVYCIASGDGAVFTGGSDWRINRWNADEPFGLLGCVGNHSLAVRCLHVTPRVLVSGADDGKVKLWPFTTIDRPCALEGHTAAVLVCVTHRGLLWTGGEDATVRLWTIDGNRQCVKTITSHRTPVVAFQPMDNLMLTFDKGGNGMVWDLKNAPNDVEALHCYQALGGVHPAVSATSSGGAASAGTSRSASEASAAFVASQGAPSSAAGGRRSSLAGSAAGGTLPSNSKTIAASSLKLPQTIRDVRVVANVNGFIAWIFTPEGAKLSFLPYRSIEEELEVKYGDLGDLGDDAMMSASSKTVAGSIDELRRQLEDVEQREERQLAMMEEIQEEFADFSDILGADLAEVLEESMELFIGCQQRMTNLYCASVALVHQKQLKQSSALNKRTAELDRQIDELTTKLNEKARQLAQSNTRTTQQLNAKSEEMNKLQLDLQRAHNETKQAQYEAKTGKETIATLEAMLRKHEAKLERGAKGEVELSQLRAELKVTKDALERMQNEVGRQAEEQAKSRAKVMGDDAERSALLQDMEQKFASAREAELVLRHELRQKEADVRAATSRAETAEQETSTLMRRMLAGSTDGAEGGSILQEHVVSLQKDVERLREENTVLQAGGGSCGSGAAVSSIELERAKATIAELQHTFAQIQGGGSEDAAAVVFAERAEELTTLRAEVAEKNDTIRTLNEKQAEAAQLQGAIDEMKAALKRKSSKKTSGGTKGAAGAVTPPLSSAAASDSDAASSAADADGGPARRRRDVPASVDQTAHKEEVDALQATIKQLNNDLADREQTISELRTQLRAQEASVRRAELRMRGDRQENDDSSSHGSSADDDDDGGHHAHSSRRRRRAGSPRPRQHQPSTVGGAEGTAAAGHMSALERMSYNVDDDTPAYDHLAGLTPSHPSRVSAAMVGSPAAGGSDAMHGSGPSASVRYSRSNTGNRAGLVALREAERILGAHAISLSGTAADLLIGGLEQPMSAGARAASRRSGSGSREVSRAPPPPTRGGGPGVVVESVIDLSDAGDSRPVSPQRSGTQHARQRQQQPSEDELGRLVRHLDETQQRLTHLEGSLSRAASPTLREGILSEMASLHHELTAAGTLNATAWGAADESNVLQTAQQRLRAADRVRALQEAPLFGPGSISPRRQRTNTTNNETPLRTPQRLSASPWK